MVPKTVVTSFSPDGYERYGRRFLDAFVKHWPLKRGELELTIFYEAGQLEVHKYRDSHGVMWLPINLVDGLEQYMDAISYFPMMAGETGQGYTIATDARMARKTFIQHHMMKVIGGKIFWIDADVVTHADVPADFLDDVLPDDKFSCYLGRPNFYTESGFLGFNATHPIAKGFMDGYRDVFRTGVIFMHHMWHDCIAYDLVRQAAVEQGLADAFVDLGKDLDPGPGLNIFVNSRLGAYMDHLKGPRKGTARSPETDLTVERTEPHWQAPAANSIEDVAAAVSEIQPAVGEERSGVDWS